MQDKVDDKLARIIFRSHFHPDETDKTVAEKWNEWPTDRARAERHAKAVRAFLLSDEAVAVARDAILENLRDRRLLKWLFAENPENHGAIGYVDGPIDAETQNECAGSLARAALSSALEEG